MAVKRNTTASRADVWAAIADGWTYSQWVVGNSRMRAVDPHWPQTGSTIRHSVGVWPLLLNDTTIVEDCEPPRLLVLQAKGRPFGKARITMRLFDLGDGGCRIEMAEVPVGAPLGWVPKRLALAAAFPRNRECTARLAMIAERRTPDDAE
ncbi:SRPBCC family protein [Candidatus Mycobacterium wuenschmannii]|uniref:SRPBCC family protein n=1 Tax=Candidatus Mycobacterium wuenschmannii TaxID=3027808 RepID=A0ABY8W4G8_9MYCO|nr:SRPBCC family protein [Candidatus Mycobacterium wuenschmannii]WIM90085.1 SRPBCC family protein [Candidatus Mycobacterium wuenschmannii]